MGCLRPFASRGHLRDVRSEIEMAVMRSLHSARPRMRLRASASAAGTGGHKWGRDLASCQDGPTTRCPPPQRGRGSGHPRRGFLPPNPYLKTFPVCRFISRLPLRPQPADFLLHFSSRVHAKGHCVSLKLRLNASIAFHRTMRPRLAPESHDATPTRWALSRPLVFWLV